MGVSIGSSAQGTVKSAEMQVVKILADGTRVPITRQRWHRNWFVRTAWRVQDFFNTRRLRNGNQV